MYLSFATMYNRVLAEARMTGDTNMTTRVKEYLNIVKWEMERKLDIPELHAIYPFSTTNADLFYVLPIDVNGIINVKIVDKNTGGLGTLDKNFARALYDWSADEFDWRWPNNRTDTTYRNIPVAFRVKRVDAIQTDTNVSGSYTMASDNAGDTTQVVSLVAYVDTARQKPATFTGTLNGTTVVTLGTATQAIAASKSATTTGLVTISKGATTIAQIGPYFLTAFQNILEPNPLPDDVYDCELRYRRRSPPMTNDSDAPWFFPAEGEMVLVKGAKVMALDYIGDLQRLVTAREEFMRARDEFLLNRKEVTVQHIGWSFGQEITTPSTSIFPRLYP